MYALSLSSSQIITKRSPLPLTDTQHPDTSFLSVHGMTTKSFKDSLSKNQKLSNIKLSLSRRPLKLCESIPLSDFGERL